MLCIHWLLTLHVTIGNCFLGDLLAAALGSATRSSVGTTVESRGEGVGFDEGVDVRGIGDGDREGGVGISTHSSGSRGGRRFSLRLR